MDREYLKKNCRKSLKKPSTREMRIFGTGGTAPQPAFGDNLPSVYIYIYSLCIYIFPLYIYIPSVYIFPLYIYIYWVYRFVESWPQVSSRMPEHLRHKGLMQQRRISKKGLMNWKISCEKNTQLLPNIFLVKEMSTGYLIWMKVGSP